MRLGIVACDILKPEIEHLTEGDPDFVVKEYLEFALHEYPQEMRMEIIKTVNKYEGSLDAVFLGYAICQSLDGVIRELKVPTVMLPGADCIDALLGSAEYSKERKTCCGTWFITPGWAEHGIEGLVKEMHLDSFDGVDPQFFLDMLFESYQRCLFIDDGIGKSEYYKEKAGAVARQLKLKLCCRTCGTSSITEAIMKTKMLASKKGE